MLRAALEGLLLFLTPFLLFGAWVAWNYRGGNAKAKFSGALAKMTLVGLILCILGIIWAAFRAEHRQGPYQPAEIRDGVIVPGTVR